MKANVGQLDGTVRVIAGLWLVTQALTEDALWGWLGIPLALSAFFRFCPLYRLVGLSTVSKLEQQRMEHSESVQKAQKAQNNTDDSTPPA